MLYLVATPIGNLGDITYRAIETFKSCDLILCEDTRRSRILLKHYDVDKPLASYHKFNEAATQDRIIAKLKNGETIALISDAGTPAIADPGHRLIKRCVAEGLPIEGIPGPCAAILALTCSGLETERFQFVGFLPKKSGRLKRILEEALSYPGTTICYESPHRLLKVLKALDELDPERQVVVGRELTKKFEEFKRGTSSELLEYWKEKTLKGELVLLISEFTL